MQGFHRDAAVALVNLHFHVKIYCRSAKTVDKQGIAVTEQEIHQAASALWHKTIKDDFFCGLERTSISYCTIYNALNTGTAQQQCLADLTSQW